MELVLILSIIAAPYVWNYIVVPIGNYLLAGLPYQTTAQQQQQQHNDVPAAVSTMPERAWLSLLNDKPQEVPHIRVNGATGTGKTTFVTALLTARKGHICIITPKHRDTWGALPFVTLDTGAPDRFVTIRAITTALIAEVNARLSGQSGNDQLTIVLDDYPVLVRYAPEVNELLELVTLIGRSECVRLIVLTQSNRVELNGVKGKGDLLEGFVTINLSRAHAATMIHDGQTVKLDTRNVTRIAQQPLHLVPWSVPIPQADSAHESENTGIGTDGMNAVLPDTDAEYQDIPAKRADTIRKAAAAGVSRNDIATMIGGNRTKTYAMIRAVLDENEQQ